MANPRGAHVTTQLKISAVRELLLNGKTRSDIVEYAEVNWNIGDRQADEYIAKARAHIDEINLSSAESNLADITRNLWALYEKHLKEKAWGGARGVLLDIARLRGLDRIDINLNLVRKHAGASSEELAAAMAKHE